MRIKITREWKAWMFAVICMFTVLMCHIEWSHIKSREAIAVALECYDVRADIRTGKAGPEIDERLKHLKAALDGLGSYAEQLKHAMPFLRTLEDR